MLQAFGSGRRIRWAAIHSRFFTACWINRWFWAELRWAGQRKWVALTIQRASLVLCVSSKFQKARHYPWYGLSCCKRVRQALVFPASPSPFSSSLKICVSLSTSLFLFGQAGTPPAVPGRIAFQDSHLAVNQQYSREYLRSRLSPDWKFFTPVQRTHNWA